MQKTEQNCYVKTVPDRCRVCFTCVRECPSKSIRIADGQAQVVPERCIGCGNCVRVCSQGAKQVVTSIERVEILLNSGAKVAACVAPSFPAEYQAEFDFRILVGMIKGLGFDQVTEVAFGADLVSERYRRLLAMSKGKKYITTSCPAVVGFVEQYHPELVSYLAPICSPMVAMARALRHLHGDDLRIVFIGPCVGKKVEADGEEHNDEIDAALTFVELREMFSRNNQTPANSEPSEFSPPHPGLGALYPLYGGSLQAAGIKEDLVTGEVVSADGLHEFVSAIEELERGNLESTLLDLLCCNGCIMGPGMSTNEPMFRRRSRISNYVNYRLGDCDKSQWHAEMSRMAGLDLSRGFHPKDRRLPSPSQEELKVILGRMGKDDPANELNCGACGYETCRDHSIAIHKGLAESEMCLPYLISELEKAIHEISFSHKQLEEAQEQLMQSEKLASMGQLAAGVAHELNNPLGVVLMYAHLVRDNSDKDSELFKDLTMITEQSDRCKNIVGNLLDFSRQNKVLLQSVSVEEIVLRALNVVPRPKSIETEIVLQHKTVECEIDPDQMIQVLTNLLTNAVGAMPEGGRLTVSTHNEDNSILFRISDTGVGISEENLPKIFQPFFTTKQIGKGTGLGLAVTYGIVKMHRGDIEVESNDSPEKGSAGTTFTIRIPLGNRAA